MKIKKIKVNSFGNLSDKEIELKDGINIIQGSNESGKSTLLKFISAMFYGLAKTKNGKEISDFDKYKPWNGEEFSGKIIYELDNCNEFEIFRDFNKKIHKIYNSKGEDISNDYAADKAKGNLFFFEQTGITEEILMKTAISEQGVVKLDKEEQNIILQKLSNVISTGNENVSYKKALSRLKDKQTGEVGTERTIGRPLNLVRKNLSTNNDYLRELQVCKEKVTLYEEEKSNLKKQIEEEENKFLFLQDIKILKESLSLDHEKLNINKKALCEITDKLKDIDIKKKEIEKKYNVKKNIKNIILFIVFLILTLLIVFTVKNLFILIPFIVAALIFFVLQIYGFVKNKKLNDEKNDKILNLVKEGQIIENSRQQKEYEVKELERIYNIKIKEENKKLEDKYAFKIDRLKIHDFLQQSLEDVNNSLRQINDDINELKIKFNTLEITYQNILEKLEMLPKIEETIEKYKEEENSLISLNNAINLAKQVLEEAYEKMKENITPEFIKNISEMVQEISNFKYSKLQFSDANGLVIQLENGDYIKADKLSMGTIDQMYFALRISALKEITKEKMPIILDEVFVYYDNDRLKNVLKFLNDKYKDEQIVIFTCANREIELLNNESMKYNSIKL